MSVTRYKVEELECCFQADMIESPTGEYVLHSDYARLKAEVERLRKAGDKLAGGRTHTFTIHGLLIPDPDVVAWNAAKEGKQP